MEIKHSLILEVQKQDVLQSRIYHLFSSVWKLLVKFIHILSIGYHSKFCASVVSISDQWTLCIYQAARVWHVDVAKFLIEHKADVNLADNYGRTALHIAAAVDYGEMVTFLIENGGTLM